MKQITSIFLVATLFAVSCVKKRNMSENEVVVHIPANPNGLHVTNDLSAYRAFVFEYVHRPLLRADMRTLELAPILVTGLPVESEDKRHYTYELRKDVKWDNGAQLTVEDVIFSVKLILSPLTDNPQLKGNFISVIKNMWPDPDDKQKFILETHEPGRANREIMTEVFILEKKKWDPAGLYDKITFADLYNPEFKATAELQKWSDNFNAPEKSKDPQFITGLGAYKLTKWVDDSYLILEKKKNWWGDSDTSMLLQNEPDRIIFKIIKDESSTYYALRNENIDAINRIGLTKLIKLQEHEYFNKSYQSDFIDQYAYSYIGMNMKPDGVAHKPFFTDKNVRRAMAYLIPVDDIIKILYKGKASRQVSFLSSLKKEYNRELPLIEFSPEKAVQLLEAAGWRDSDGDNVRDKKIGGEKIQFSFKMNYMSDAPPSREICLMIKDEMYRAGIDLVPNPVDFSVFYEKAYTHDFDALMGAWQGSALYEDPTQLWHTSQWANFGANFCGFGNSVSDSLIAAMNYEVNDSLYIVKCKALQKLIYDEQPYIFLFSPKARIAIHRRFEGKMYAEKPQFFINAFKLLQSYSSTVNTPDIVQ